MTIKSDERIREAYIDEAPRSEGGTNEVEGESEGEVETIKLRDKIEDLRYKYRDLLYNGSFDVNTRTILDDLNKILGYDKAETP